MSQRDSGYARKDNDCYETPEWVTQALAAHIPSRVQNIWEPAAGSGKIVRALEAMGYNVVGTDITDGRDFLTLGSTMMPPHAIITNPPYGFSEEFCNRAIDLMCSASGFVAMLLRTDFDHAKTRKLLFTDAPFAKKLVLTKRIRWFENTTGSPSFNHAWFIWDWQHKGAPTLAYGP